MSSPSPSQGERVQKVLAMAGVGSRRECETLILEGRVEIDRQVVTELGTRVDPEESELRLDGEVVRVPRMMYLMVNKPTGVVTTNWDPEGRMRVIDLVRSDYRLFPVGRLDRTSEGLILLTNDGDLANQLTHPRYGVSKTYQVVVAGHPRHDELQVLCRGVHLAEGLAKAESVAVKKRSRQSSTVEIVLREGKNREIRRLLARVGHKVLRLKRIAQGPLRLGGLAVGDSRTLTRDEVGALRRACRSPRQGKRSKTNQPNAAKQPKHRKALARRGKAETAAEHRGEALPKKRRSAGHGEPQQEPIRAPDWASTLGAILDYDSSDGPADGPADQHQGATEAGRSGPSGRTGRSGGRGKASSKPRGKGRRTASKSRHGKRRRS